MGNCVSCCQKRDDSPGEQNLKSPEKREIEPLTKTTYNTLSELFLINRILFGNKKKLLKQDKDVETQFRDVVSDISTNEQELCVELLLLLFKNGIKKYLSKYYVDTHCKTIDTLFNSVIMQKYTSEYENEITMSPSLLSKSGNNNNGQSNEFECLLFNQIDLVPQIFQYLELKDLNNCSMVNFLWFFHSFSINSLYYLPFHVLLKSKWIESQVTLQQENKSIFGKIGASLTNKNNKTINNNNSHDAIVGKILPLRIWQRFINSRKIDYESGNAIDDETRSEVRRHIYTHFKSLQNVEMISFRFRKLTPNDILFMKALAAKSNKIIQFDGMQYRSRDDNFLLTEYGGFTLDETTPLALPVIKLPNAEVVFLTGLSLPMILSSKCEELVYGRLKINRQMYLNLINDSDLSGVKKVCIGEITLDITNHWDVQEEKKKGYNDDDDDKDAGGDIDGVVSSNYDRYVEIPSQKKEVFDKLAKKLTNVEKIAITKPDDDTLLFWKSLIPIADKNGCKTKVTFTPSYISYKDEKNEVLAKYKNMVKFIKDNNIKVTDAQISIIDSGMPFLQELFETADINTSSTNIFSYVESVRMSGYETGSMKFVNLFKKTTIAKREKNKAEIKEEDDNNDNINDSDMIDDIFKDTLKILDELKEVDELKEEKINVCVFSNGGNKNAKHIKSVFPNVLCFNCSLTMIQNNDWKLFCDFLKFNSNDSNNKSKNKNRLFWKLNLSMGWSTTDEFASENEMVELVEYLKQLFYLVDNVFIKQGKPIDFRAEFYSYNFHFNYDNDGKKLEKLLAQEKEKDNTMSKVFDQHFKPVFFQQFGNFAFVMSEVIEPDNDIKKKGINVGNNDESIRVEDSIVNKYKEYQIPMINQRCKALTTPEIWCNYANRDIGKIGNICEMEFVVRNAISNDVVKRYSYWQ